MSTFQKYNLVLFIVLAVLLLSSPLISFISFNSVDAQRQGKPPGSGGGSGGGPPPGSGGGPPPQPPATLIVFKQVINDNGGTAQASDFTFSVIFRSCDGSTSGTGQLQASSQGVTIQMNAQDTCGYQVFELVPETYTLTAMSGECQRSSITPGATYTCTIVNNDNPSTAGQATVIVTKVVNGGPNLPGDFTLCVETDDPNVDGDPGVPATPNCAPGSGSGFAYTVKPGAIAISEPVIPTGYTHAITSTCSPGIVVAGETAMCTLTNTFIGS